MNLQAERIAHYCEQLGLHTTASCWHNLAKKHLENEGTYGDFIEALLQEELSSKDIRTQNTLLKFAGLSQVKTLEDYDFNYASGAPKSQLQELGGLGFIERCENIVMV